MDDTLDEMRPEIAEISDLQASLDVVATRLEALDEMTASLDSVRAELTTLSGIIDGLDGLEQQLELTNEQLDHLLLLRQEIQGITRRLDLLDELNGGIGQIHGSLQGVEEQIVGLTADMTVINREIERLSSIDEHLVAVNEGIKKLLLLAALAIPFLGLFMLAIIYNQRQTRRLLAGMVKLPPSSAGDGRKV